MVRDEDNTVGIWFRIDGDSVDNSGCILNLAGQGALETSANNFIWNLDYFKTTKIFRWVHESGPGTNVLRDITNVELKYHKWYYVVVRMSEKNLIASTMTFEIFLNGSLIYKETGMQIATDGADSQWHMGSRKNGAATYYQFLPVSIASVSIWQNALSDGLILSDYHRGILYDSFTSTDVQVGTPVQYNGSYPNPAFFDFSDALGMDWLTGVSIDDSLDDPTMKASFSLARFQERLNLSPYITDSLLNVVVPENDPPVSGSYSPILGVGSPYRYIEIRAARVPLGTQPIDYQWTSVFQGVVDTIDFGDAEVVNVSVRDYGAILLNAYAETEVEFGSAGGTPIQTVLQNILDEYDSTGFTGSYPSNTLIVDGDPSWAVLPFKRKREPVISMLRAVAEQLGWLIAFKFVDDPGVNDWRVTLYEPSRENFVNSTGAITSYFLGVPSATISLGSQFVTALSKGTVSTERIRNVVRVAYPSSELLQGAISLPSGVSEEDRGLGGIDNEGRRTPAYLQLIHSGSAGSYGRRFMEIQEDQSSQIDTIVEANRFCLAALSDLFQPDFDATLDCVNAFEVEVDDVVMIPGNDVWSTGPQRVAVQTLSHTFSTSNGSSFNVHGKPSAGFKTWATKEARPGLGPPPVLGAGGVLTGRELGTQLLGFEGTQERTSYGMGGKFVQVRNPSFSTFTMGLNNPPDGWKLYGAASWGTDILSSTESASGTTSVKITDAVNFSGVQVNEASIVPVDGDVFEPYALSAIWKRPAGVTDDSIILGVEWLLADKVTQSGAPASFSLSTPVASNNAWQESKQEGILPPGPTSLTKWARPIFIRQNGATSGDIYIDSISFYHNARKSRAVNGINDAHNGGMGTWNAVVFYDPDSGIAPSQTYDFGDNWDTGGSATPRSWFNVRRPGLYSVTAQVIIACDDPGSLVDGYGQIRCTKNGIYTASNVPSGGGGTVIAESNVVGMVESSFCNFNWNPGVGAPNFGYYAAVQLAIVSQFDPGDTINIEWQGYREAGVNDDTVTVCGFEESENATWCEIKLLLNE
jgi:hypothetical protein